MKLAKDEIIKELHTIRDFIRWGISEFNKEQLYFGHGTDNSWDEAVLLITHALHLSPTIDRDILDARLTYDEKIKILDLFHKRINKKIPAAYLTHEAWFAGIPFYIDERVLIPRSSIGELITKHFQPWIDSSQVHRILDIGTGSGCIAIAAAYAFPDATVDAVDISTPALAVAKHNVHKHKLEARVRVLKSDVFASLENERYDIILSNPPYVAKAELKGLPKEYTHEPKIALEAGKTGLDVVVRILKDAAKHLTAQGILIVEVGNSEAAVRAQFSQIPFTWLEFEESEGGVFLLSAQDLQTIKF